MKKLAFTALCLGSLGLLACGGGGSGDDIDSGFTVCGNGTCETGEDATSCPADCNSNPADAAGAACNPVANTGCQTGEKCTSIIESTDPFLGRTGCAPAGNVADGGACARDTTTGVDDCAGGLFCLSSVCTEICGTAPDTCGSESTCVSFVDLFDDADNTGLCQPGCNPVAAGAPASQCATGEGCYLSLTSGRGSCGGDCGDNPDCSAGTTAPSGWPNSCSGQWGTQNCNCEYLNACAPGYGCILLNDPASATGLVCSFFCDTTNSGGPTCADSTVIGSSCRQVSTFYSDTGNVPAEIGFCVPGDQFPCYGCYDTNEPGCDTTTCPP